MVFSMTGFGQSKKEFEDMSVSVELRTVNHRFFDCHIRIPHQMLKLEDSIKKLLKKYISRGRIDCYITIDGTNLIKKQLHIDWNLVDEYYQYIANLKKRFNLSGDIELNQFLMNNTLVSVLETEEINEDLEQLILSTVNEAVIQLKEMRAAEGNILTNDLKYFINHIGEDLVQVEKLVPAVNTYYEEKLRNKMLEFTNGEINEDRLLAEVAVLSERQDITEEITRLRSHLAQFLTILKEDEPVGRKLDFLVQEMNREINTIGSKSVDSTISAKVVSMKSLVEKLREQVQNIE